MSATTDASPLAAEQYNAFVTGLTLGQVEFVRVNGERLLPGRGTESRFELAGGYQRDGGTVHYRYDLSAELLDEANGVLGRVEVSAVLTAIGDVLDDRIVERFGATSGAMIVHPFLREAVASTASRVGFPGVLLPLMTVQPEDDAVTVSHPEQSGDG